MLVVVVAVFMFMSVKYLLMEHGFTASSPPRPPSTATVIGIQGDGESLLEERKGGDTQTVCLGKPDDHLSSGLLTSDRKQ